LLIAINTGMSFIDIGTLKFSQIEFDNDGMPYAIERARSKTGNSGYWKLWSITSQLLHEHLQIRNKFAQQAGKSSGFDQEPWVFLQLDPNRRTMLRQPLMYSIHYKSPSHYRHSNTLGMLMIRLKKVSKVTKKMKHLRSTGATSIRSISNNDLLLTQMFLAHSPKTVAEKHYASPTNFEDLFRCIDVMYSELGIDKLEHFIEAGQTRYKESWKWL
jgi:integrase